MYILPLWLKAGIRMAVFLTKKPSSCYSSTPWFCLVGLPLRYRLFWYGLFCYFWFFSERGMWFKAFQTPGKVWLFQSKVQAKKKQVAKCPTLSKHPWFELLSYTVRKIQWSPMELKSHSHLHSHKPWEKNCSLMDRFSFKNKGFCSPNSFSPGSGLNRQGNLEISLTR